MRVSGIAEQERDVEQVDDGREPRKVVRARGDAANLLI